MEVWKQYSTPQDRYAILSGLSAFECVESGLCELTTKEEVSYLSDR